jgi:hypothetical protein
MDAKFIRYSTLGFLLIQILVTIVDRGTSDGGSMCVEEVLTSILSRSEALGKWWSINATSLSPIIVAISVIVAAVAVWMQRRLTTQRATFDLFLKTEIDRQALDLWRDYIAALGAYQSASSVDSFVTGNAKAFNDICTYLSIYELVAIGIKNKLLDEKICFAFWHRIMRQDYHDVEKLLDYVHAQPAWRERFAAYPWLINRWKSKRA